MAWRTRCNFWRHLCRLQQPGDSDVPTASLDRVTVWSQTNTGLASVMAIGIFVLVSLTADQITGASVILSVVIACVVGTVSSVCYMDLHARLAQTVRARTAYEYTYCSTGELAAFCAGWLTLLGQTALTSMAARTISQNTDYLMDWTLANLTVNSLARQHVFGHNVDFLATVLVAAAVAVSVYATTRHVEALMVVSNVATIVALLTLCAIAMWSVNLGGWLTMDAFFPFGLKGVLTGSATVYLAFSCGQSILQSANLQTVKARTTFVKSSTICTCAVTVLLMFTGCVLTLDESRHFIAVFPETAFASILDSIAGSWIRKASNVVIVVTIAPFLVQICLKCSDTFNEIATDGLLPSCFKSTPAISSLAVLVQICVSAVAATLLDVTNLAQICCLATLATDIISAVGLVSLQHRHVARASIEQRIMSRVTCDKTEEKGTDNNQLCSSRVSVISPVYGTATDDRSRAARDTEADSSSSEDTDIDDIVEEYQESIRVSVSDTNPTADTGVRATVAIVLLCAAAAASGAIVSRRASMLIRADATSVVCLVAAILVGVLCVVVIARLPCRSSPLAGAIVRLDHARCMSVTVVVLGTLLMVALPVCVWLEATGWMAIGLLVYMVYGYRHSEVARRGLPQERLVLLKTTIAPVLDSLY